MSPRRQASLVLGAAIALFFAAAIFLMFNRDPDALPPVTLFLTQSNAPLQIFTGGDGVLMILPDGSLWSWGQMRSPGTLPLLAPTRVGTNCEWWRASVMMDHALALRTNGTLWEWGQRPNGHWAPEPEQVAWNPDWVGLDGGLGGTEADRDHDWVGIASGWQHAVALKSDGTLWAWGSASSGLLGNFPDSSSTQPLLVDTNHDWVAVASMMGDATVALRKNGTLWQWGVPSPTPTAAGATQICSDANWAGVDNGGFNGGAWAWTRQGAFWNCMYPMPMSNAPAATIFSLGQAATKPGHDAWAFTRQQSEYDIRGQRALYMVMDGLMLTADAVLPNFHTHGPRLGEWHRFGKRTDWIGVWGTGTALGLTADGTVWTWGSDLGAEPAQDLETKLTGLRVKIMAKLGVHTKRLVLPSTSVLSPPIQRRPRPLMRLVDAPSARRP